MDLTGEIAVVKPGCTSCCAPQEAAAKSECTHVWGYREHRDSYKKPKKRAIDGDHGGGLYSTPG
jgi:hypothetical protein